MNPKRELKGLIVLLIVAGIVFLSLPQLQDWIPWYDSHFYYPFQTLRGWVFGYLPVSVGDLIYVAAGVWLLLTLVKWTRSLFHFREQKKLLAISVIRVGKTVLCGYLFFVMGWGANYYKPSLATSWRLDTTSRQSVVAPDKFIQRKMSSAERIEWRQRALTELTAYDHFLLTRLNEYAPHYQARSLTSINEQASDYYGRYTDSRVKGRGLEIKPTLFGYYIRRLGVEGYYNPFTGEGQIDDELPAFSLPYLICHEMAHQAGIAAEEDANLLAYALCTATPDSTFRYSAYLNLWLYANSRLRRLDSVQARADEALLNKLTQRHIDTLEELASLYMNDYAAYSTAVFDAYLKLQAQKDGVRSYGNVAGSAWLYERMRGYRTDSVIRVW